MATDIVLASELGSEFEIGTNEPNKITLKLGGGLAKAGDGTLVASFTADPRIDLIEAYLQDRHVLQAPGVFVTQVNTPQDVINSSVTVDGGTYSVTISYMWNGDNVQDDFESYFTVNGNELVTAAAQGFLHKQEPKDAAFGGSQVGTSASGQRYAFTKVFENVTLPAGSIPVVFQISTEDQPNATEASVWNVDIIIQRTSYP